MTHSKVFATFTHYFCGQHYGPLSTPLNQTPTHLVLPMGSLQAGSDLHLQELPHKMPCFCQRAILKEHLPQKTDPKVMRNGWGMGSRGPWFL